MNRYTMINYNKGDIVGTCIFLEEAGYKIDPKYGKKRRIAKFECKCGTEFIASVSNVKRGNTNSCGCYNKQRLQEVNVKHGLNKHPLYRSWQGMKNRCYNRNIEVYPLYGGRGIKVCDEWIDSFITFYNWTQFNNWKPGLSVDRIDNDKNYEPDNCRLSTDNQQARNRRNNINVLLNGKVVCLKDYCKELNVDYSMVRTRVKKYNWSLEKAISVRRQTDVITELNG